MGRSASGGLGLTGILIIGGALYYTGYGAVILDHMQHFEKRCPMMLSSLGHTVSDPLCDGVSYGVNGIASGAEMAGDTLRSITDRITGGVSESARAFGGIDGFGGSFRRGINELSSSSDRLSQMILAGPGAYGGVPPAERFQHAIDSFSIGQHYLSQRGNAPRALPWLVHGAQQPDGYGLLSQMALGDLYRTGAGDIAANPVQAQMYYQQASQSLSQLSHNDAPQARAMLQVLPMQPQQLQQQLLMAVQQIKGGK